MFVSQQAAMWVHRTIASQRAFASLPSAQRLLVRYEELLSNTPAELRRIFDWLDVNVSEGDVEAIVARNAFNAVRRRLRGPGKAVRAATPGLWRRNLTDEEQQAVHEIMGGKLPGARIRGLRRSDGTLRSGGDAEQTQTELASGRGGRNARADPGRLLRPRWQHPDDAAAGDVAPDRGWPQVPLRATVLRLPLPVGPPPRPAPMAEGLLERLITWRR